MSVKQHQTNLTPNFWNSLIYNNRIDMCKSFSVGRTIHEYCLTKFWFIWSKSLYSLFIYKQYTWDSTYMSETRYYTRKSYTSSALSIQASRHFSQLYIALVSQIMSMFIIEPNFFELNKTLPNFSFLSASGNSRNREWRSI